MYNIIFLKETFPSAERAFPKYLKVNISGNAFTS